MELIETNEAAAVVLQISGKLDAVTTPDFTDRFEKRLANGDCCFVVDCSDLIYLSSAGLRGFLTVAKQIKAKQGRLIVCGLAGVALEVFQISGFLTILETRPDRQAALAAMNG